MTHPPATRNLHGVHLLGLLTVTDSLPTACCAAGKHRRGTGAPSTPLPAVCEHLGPAGRTLGDAGPSW